MIDKRIFAERLRRHMTWPERILWAQIRHVQLGYRFQPQALLFGYIADFWCSKSRVVIEIDGSVHGLPSKASEDAQKDAVYAKNDIDCLRFENSDIRHGMSAVLIRIWEHCYARAPIPLKPFLYNLSRSSFEENSEISPLLHLIENKRIEMHEKSFSQRYWKNRVLPVHRSRT